MASGQLVSMRLLSPEKPHLHLGSRHSLAYAGEESEGFQPAFVQVKVVAVINVGLDDDRLSKLRPTLLPLASTLLVLFKVYNPMALVAGISATSLSSDRSRISHRMISCLPK